MMKADATMKGIIREAVLQVMYACGIRFTTPEVSYIVVRFKKLFLCVCVRVCTCVYVRGCCNAVGNDNDYDNLTYSLFSISAGHSTVWCAICCPQVGERDGNFGQERHCKYLSFYGAEEVVD